MSAIPSTLRAGRAGLHRGSIRVTTIASVGLSTHSFPRQLTSLLTDHQASQRRSVSWIPWEQPNPQLYMNQNDPVHQIQPPEDSPTDTNSSDKQTPTDTPSTQDVPKVDETTDTPTTTTVGTGNQEVSKSGKTAPPSFYIRNFKFPDIQKRSMHTDRGGSSGNGSAPTSAPLALHPPPTTLLRIPDMPSTWPGEESPYPDQPRVRKQRINVLHELSSLARFTNTTPTSTNPTTNSPTNSKEEEQPTIFPDTLCPPIQQVLNDIYPVNLDPNTSLTFEEAVARYMEGVKEREAIRAAEEECAAREAVRRVLGRPHEEGGHATVWVPLDLAGEGQGDGEGQEGGEGRA
ncbi:hypothetical protein F4805DRAFT_427349 [Annulohypoxylon moriforme]|nr:hypothetical protein F4805DRAFT_427349 [Annulohypoxylon moriforme]